MLYDILKGKQTSPFVLIQDTLLQGGIFLLRAFIQELVNKGDQTIHILCFENHPNYVKSGLKLTNHSANIQFHDCCTDHRSWNNEQEGDTYFNLYHSSERVLGDRQKKVFLIVDSLSVIISNIGVAKCYQQLHSIIQDWPQVQLYCLVHEDFLPKSSETILKLRHLATTCLQVTPTDPVSERAVVFSTHVKPGGKLIRRAELFFVDQDMKVFCQEYMPNDTKPSIGVPEVKEKLPKELTTFKLDLDVGEQEARNKVVLPYLRREEGGGKVFYQPDDADDWDEEDPDDDLDI